MDQCSDSEGGGSTASEEEIDQIFKEMAGGLMVPYQNECMVCFLWRAMSLLKPYGFAMTTAYQRHSAPRATPLIGRLLRLNIFNDRQLLQTGVVINEAIWNTELCPDCGIPYSVPDCLEVRRGSTQPCKLWRWRKDIETERFDAWLVNVREALRSDNESIDWTEDSES